MFYTFAYVCDLQKAQHQSALQTSLPSFSTRSRLQSNHITSKKSMAKTTCDFAACCPVLPLTSLLIVMEVKSSQTWQSGSSGNFTIKRRLNSFPAQDCPSNPLKAATPNLVRRQFGNMPRAGSRLTSYWIIPWHMMPPSASRDGSAWFRFQDLMLRTNLKPSNHVNQALMKLDLIPTFCIPRNWWRSSTLRKLLQGLLCACNPNKVTFN